MPKQLLTLLAASFFVLSLGGCVDDNDGPVEEAGEAVDEAINDASRAVEDATD